MSKNKLVLEPFDPATVNKKYVVGVDEVGRGCLAGPVYAGAVLFKNTDSSFFNFDQLTDSKLISEKRREQISKEILVSHYNSLAFATPEEIDEINILQASFLAMKRALKELFCQQQEVNPNFTLDQCAVIVDGHMKIPNLGSFLGLSSEFQILQIPLIKGDLRCKQVSAASIIAKVARDQWMKEMDQRYPEYGFKKHKGYASATHREAIEKFRPCQLHRKSFSGVKEYL